jgi:GxxExxY protein
MKKTKAYYKDLIYRINGAAIEVHKEIGAGLLESVYHKCLAYELQKRNIQFKSELRIPICYKDMELDADLRCDLLVEDDLVVELKSLDKILPIHEAQLLTYMKLLQAPIGLMINFNCTHIFNEGQKTYVNDWYRILDDE